MIKGSITALVTPFRSGEIDKQALSRLIKFQLQKGTDGILVCGTTGEASTLSDDEKFEVLETALKEVDSKVPVLMGTGTNNTAQTVKLTRKAKEMGADGALVITPYYNKPTQKGLIRHFEEIANSSDLPIILYNVPSRTGINMQPSTICKLKEDENIVAIKEASGSLEQVIEIIRLCGDSISVLSGDDGIVLPVLSVGGKGVISTTANILPAEFSRICSEFESGNVKEAAKIQLSVFPVYRAMFLETNPIPVKAALAMMGMIGEELRLPLTPISSENRSKLKSILKDHKLID